MSVTVDRIMRLSAMKDAEVVAGHLGLQKTVTSISVLEYSEPSELQAKFFNLEEFRRGELVLSGFSEIRDSVEKQCEVIRRLHRAGEAGLVLFHVGIVLPRIDEKLIELADELGFPLISMPENHLEYQYGSVIYEVTEEIIKEKMSDTNIIGEVLEKIVYTPPYRRSMDYLLKLLSNRISATIYLLDDHFRLLNASPSLIESRYSFSWLYQTYGGDVKKLCDTVKQSGEEQNLFLNCQTVNAGNQTSMYLVLMREGSDFVSASCWQVREIVQLFIRVWGSGYGSMEKDEILKAILLDEQMKLQRLSESLQFNVSALHHMIVIASAKNRGDSASEILRREQKRVNRILDKHYTWTISGIFDQCLTILTSEENVRGTYEDIIQNLQEEIQGDKDDWKFVVCRGLNGTTDIRNTFVECKTYLQDAMTIFPKKKLLTSKEIQFAGKCRQVLFRGEESVQAELLPLKDLDERWDGDLYKTLETYFLDADMSIVKTAEILYLHKNTIKYRISKLTEIFHYRINKMPEAYDLYRAVAIHRLITKLNLTSKYRTVR